jgi:hypothetical protein
MDSSQSQHGTKLAVELDAGFLRLPLHRALGQITHGGNLGERETAEELHQIYNLSEQGFGLREFVQCLADLG